MKHINKKRFDFLMIDYKQDLDKRFRKNFDTFLKVKTGDESDSESDIQSDPATDED